MLAGRSSTGWPTGKPHGNGRKVRLETSNPPSQPNASPAKPPTPPRAPPAPRRSRSTCAILGSISTKRRNCTTTTSAATTAGRGGIRRGIRLGWMGGGIGLGMWMGIRFRTRTRKGCGQTGRFGGTMDRVLLPRQVNVPLLSARRGCDQRLPTTEVRTRWMLASARWCARYRCWFRWRCAMRLPGAGCLVQQPQHSVRVVCAHGFANEYRRSTELPKLRAQICSALPSSEDHMSALPCECKNQFESNWHS